MKNTPSYSPPAVSVATVASRRVLAVVPDKRMRTATHTFILLGLMFSVMQVMASTGNTAESPATALATDEQVLAAHRAFLHGDRGRLQRQQDAIVAAGGHPLLPYVESWQFMLNLPDKNVPDKNPAEIQEFLSYYQGTAVADDLRTRWLRKLGLHKEWALFAAEYPKLPQPDQELRCFELRRRMLTNEPGTMDAARPIWFSAQKWPDACEPLMDDLVADGQILVEDVWARIRRLQEVNKLDVVVHTAAYLPAVQRPDRASLQAISRNPARALDKLPSRFHETRRGRELALFAVQRLARSDAGLAGRKWAVIESRFSPSEQRYALGQLAWQGATQHLPQALAWYEKTSPAELSDEQHEWAVRAALRSGAWGLVMNTINRMPSALSDQPVWAYWRGRAHAALGQPDEAKALFEKLAVKNEFYGYLAVEELGGRMRLPPAASQVSEKEIELARTRPETQRALALLSIGLREEGLRAWSRNLEGQSDRELLALSQLARESGIHDRAISAANMTVDEHDYRQRYPTPFSDQVMPRADALALDSHWVYGLMRQESRFATHAKSSAGAAGLMQVMPATARWVAKRIGLKDYRGGRIADAETNLTLGMNYLKLVLDSLDGHPVLASAAYNAGPKRAERWRDAGPLEGAIYAETIPFSETREYVKRVMANAAFYSALAGNQPALKERLGVVAAKESAQSAAKEVLP